MKINSYAKINLSLDVLGLREDGYHNIDTIMNLIDLHDIMDINRNSTYELNLSSNNPDFPTDKTNLIFKIFENLKKFRDINYGYDVYVDKQIPISAGLAGGSSNACEFLMYVNDDLSLNLSDQEIKEICRLTGADTFYFTNKKCVRATGIGNEFVRLSDFSNKNIIIVNNGMSISSKDVYDNLKESNVGLGKVSVAIDSRDYETFFKVAFNTMESVSEKLVEEISVIKDQLNDLGADLSLMSGSGPTVFGIFENTQDYENCYNKLKDKYKYVFKTKTL
ncbi:MAG: 4-(cytidine 5'-diphospho)-2-C-methyl-D-erythritol kinase [Finegoldia magna]|uniref:4-(cytidine 5'-diphospho)-2-C-methyl-D-erythritol kinase n=1 Tax=Finegoldia magna TaxID=1260 RepID=UPI000B9185B4|nr:4-(cytidine 5'-diphospho)-2-C-methyl-D-erythritol kinase [Finegoldia magna]MDU1010607.1 4-(cytidine 5'-diphospho)-2-C-methyl-D-erythritol kinase [Finegoldia magna]MDU1088041.1 4-(cytidine 5'-diphospho)-2-C-methyl-D-erythritol kinase [Finegoldia magna]MDU7890455.1 4-(cytidine 5'-diphospho)-2-C-methyl-D-erythritol kinase [Finegoldia magna]MDU7925854.1 4-(cytidine 5'-diphospho)-2-C-methyl-D-erythritol kinase [Finegoldia magna]OXZ39296.1 4-(cytidine 5'-diphospho)-2-C-methyl-D-erythritol kinase 